MKLKKMLKTFLSETNIVLADVDEPANENSYSKHFPTVFRKVKTFGTARELRGEVNSWVNIDNCEVVLAGITYWVNEQGCEDTFIVLYFRVEK
ncbi:TPA: hypothetical protein ACXLHF_004056 [Klebsiella pneumoniae]